MKPTLDLPDQCPPPTISTSADALRSADADMVAIGFTSDDGAVTVGLGADIALSTLGVDVFALLDRASATGSAGEVVVHEVFGESSSQTVLLVGLGSGDGRHHRRAGAAVTRAAKGKRRVATSIGALADDDDLAAFVEGLVLGAFSYALTSGHALPTSENTGGGSPANTEPLDIVLTDMGEPSRGGEVKQAATRAAASWRARTFALTPSNLKSPVRLEQWAREAASVASLDIDVWDDKRLLKEGFGGIVAVGRGSAYASRFVRLDYAPRRAARRTPHIVIVGKGITFDSGGISIKPRAAMETMKRDMTGAGVVIAVMGALRDLEVAVRVTGLVACAENAFGAASMRPGDVVTHYGGRTSEVGNTDAEGRLVLADALAYADETIDADVVVDVATLTGAGKVALGTSLGALFANDDGLAAALTAAGALAGEPVWRLPLSDEYEPLLSNPVADATNAAGGPGAITAALYLQHFAGKSQWAHLDIASVGDSPHDEFEYTQGATGFGARLLLRWLTLL